jgi:hypothetical protein
VREGAPATVKSMKTAALALRAPAVALSLMMLAGCAAGPQAVGEGRVQDAFFANLTALCGQTFEGKVVTDDPADADFRRQRLVIHVRDCSADEIRIPFHVGEDHSRTWVITRTPGGLTLKHDHRDPDGTAHTLHWYGGDTVDAGTATRQEFPVDAFSIALFNANNAAVSTTNVWAVEVNPGETYVYELSRENRLLRVAFDLTKPVGD